ncbi:thiol:disulfide interchange protein DsbG [Paraburkholderia fungorum]|uniref:thiol:disulfide interchange protein DsbG n=1 Tax=Paraburkholderia fungorum TaxID=134537 RepID=UPI000486EC63|nr:thiol:disulfide interchange protein DsbG [Paraburkholderia fungorum]PNE59722.1 thiol:disulfide interchange protein DsbG [Paraburkholderia fungorum]
MDTQQAHLPVSIAGDRLDGVRRVLLIAALYMGLPSSQAAAAPIAATSDPVVRVPASAEIPSVVRVIAPGPGQVVGTFDAPGGFKGWLVMEGHPFAAKVVFTTPDKKYLLIGDLVGPDRFDLTERYTEELVKRPLLEHAWPDIERAAAVREGASSPKAVIYAFADPNCIYCHLLWKALQPYEAAGLQVRWILIGLIKQDSFGKAAAMLEAKDPSAAMRRLQAGYVEASESGAIQPVVGSSATQAALHANMDLFKRLQLYGTPAILYKDRVTGQPVARQGFPRLRDLSQITGLPLTHSTDPELTRYW